MTCSPEQAWAWRQSRGWLCGFNYVPTTAVNSTEIWQQESFDLVTLDRELGWAQEIGFNSLRIFLQYLVWEADPNGFAARLDAFLGCAQRHGLSVIPILFDDCAFASKEPHLGPQDAPVPGVHNSGWTPSPGPMRVRDRDAWPLLKSYVVDVISRFGRDDRVLAWDLYNEPGNCGMGAESLPLLETAFEWARECTPVQPLTAAVWAPELTSLNQAMCEQSDIISFHDYGDVPAVAAVVERLREYGRPLLCTEWMRRGFGSHFETHLPYFHEHGIGCFFWGLVNGRTQTHFPWGSAQGAPDPGLWFHDLLTAEGVPHSSDELALIRAILQQKRALPE